MLDETWWNTVPHLSVNFNKYALVIWLHFVILLQKKRPRTGWQLGPLKQVEKEKNTLIMVNYQIIHKHYHLVGGFNPSEKY